MVNKISKNNKDKYQRAGKNNKFYFVGIALALVIGVFVFVNMGGSSTQALAGPAPSGDNCPENVAYLQSGVDKYKEVVGTFPTELKELTELKEGKGPFVEKLVECPSGNIYIIENGIVKEGKR